MATQEHPVQPSQQQTPAPQPPEHPLTQLQRRMSQMFDDVFGHRGSFWNLPTLDSGPDWLADFNPRMDVTDDPAELTITVEIPGIEEKDIDVSLTDNLLTIKGEKHAESEEKGKDFLRRERSYGTFRRSMRVGPEIDASKVDATFKNGVLRVTLPKTPAAQKAARKIPIHS
ncbi:MAG TPA: Hsp20/alpha crystallin family protein [bacterium]|nr:Hsp20/alpha crystallin family protein [bacterium]